MTFARKIRAMNSRRKILFVGEAVTLAHVVRPRVLAESLDPARYDAILASDIHIPISLRGMRIPHKKIDSRTPVEFIAVLEKTGILFDYKTLKKYAEEERRLIDAVQPDLIVGDLRPSLAVSAAHQSIPLVTLSNAYWSPYAVEQSLPFPYANFIRVCRLQGAFGRSIIRLLEKPFQSALPKIYAQQNEGINKLRGENGLEEYDSYKSGFVYGDYTLYCDLPSVVRTENLPPHHRYLGPVQWSPACPKPLWWSEIPVDKPIVFVNLGSSGDARLLPMIVAAVRDSGAVAIAVTTYSSSLKTERPWLFTAPYLPGEDVVQRADLVITNGGSPSSYQALGAGKPVIGIPANMDQLLFMRELESLGLCRSLRADSVSQRDVTRAVRSYLNLKAPDPRFQEISTQIHSMSSCQIFCKVIEEIFSNNYKESYERVHNM